MVQRSRASDAFSGNKEMPCVFPSTKGSIAVGLRTQKLCPVDQKPITEFFLDRHAVREIVRIEVLCVFRAQGCKWTGMIFKLMNHLSACEFALTWKTCEFRIINCDKKEKESRIEQHYIDDEAHHLGLIGLKGNKIHKKMRNTENDIKAFSYRILDISRQIGIHFDSTVAIHTAMKGKDTQIENTKLELQVTLDADIQTEESLKEFQANSSSTGFLSNILDIADRFKKLSSEANRAEMLVGECPVVALAKRRSSSVDETFAKLEKEQKTARANLEDVDLKIRLFQATTTDGQYVWKIDNYERRFREAVEGKIKDLYSPPLYSNIYGYKVCCKLYLNGNSDEENGFQSHAAFYMVLMKGNSDSLVQFPFRRNFEVTLLAQNPKYNINRTIQPRLSHPAFQRPTEPTNPAYGFSTFVSHSKLSDGYYKWDDALYFKIDFTK